jgi:hypothetical protein
MKRIKLFDEYINGLKNNNVTTNEEDGNRDTLAELKEMTLGQLERIVDYANMIKDRMNKGEELESWMFSQLTISLENLNSVHDAMDGNDGIEEGYFSGISKSTADKKKAAMGKQAAMDDDDPNAYKELPGDTKGKKNLKTSTHTKKYHEIYKD